MPIELSNIHAFIAEHNSHLRMVIRDLLHDFGLSLSNVQHCGDGEAALKLLALHPSDFLITGDRMSPMDGVTLIRALRDPNRTPAPAIPIIFCSEFLDKKLFDVVRQAGANEVIVMPISAGAIRSRVTAVLERPRPTITLSDYIGPDRRRGADTWDGFDRRNPDHDFLIC